MSDILEKRIEKLKNVLEGRIGRNPLVDFSHQCKKKLRLSAPTYSDLYNRLVLKNEVLSFKRPLKTEKINAASTLLSLLESPDEPFADFYGDIEVCSSFAQQEIVLKKMQSETKTTYNRSGVNSLYISFGLLHWHCKKISNGWLNSPLVLLPVCFDENDNNSPLSIKKFSDEIIVNPLLNFCLSRHTDVRFPDFENNKNGIEDFLLNAEKIAAENGWKISKNVHISVLSTSDLLLVRYLFENENLIVNSKILQLLSGEKTDEKIDFDADKKTLTAEIFYSDHYQKKAMNMASDGLSFIVDGTVGTGKTRIAENIIADSLGNGKKIIYVAPNTTKISEVYNDLCSAGLGDFCLPVFQSDGNEIFESFAGSFNAKNKKVFCRQDFDNEEFNDLKESYNEYINELADSNNFAEISACEAARKFAEYSHSPTIIATEKMLSCKHDEFLRLVEIIKEYSAAVESLNGKILENPWNNSTLKIPVNLDAELIEAAELKLNSIAENLAEAEKIIASLNEKYSLNLPLTLEKLPEIITKLENYSCPPQVPEVWITSEKYQELLEFAEKMQNLTEQIRHSKSKISKIFSKEILQENIAEWQQKIARLTDEISSLPIIEKQEISLLLGNIDSRIFNADNIVSELDKCSSDFDEINKIVGTDFEGKIAEIDRAKNLQKLLEEPFNLPAKFLSQKDNQQARELLEKYCSTAGESDNISHQLFLNWDGAVLEIDPLAQKEKWSEIKNDISKISIFNTSHCAEFCSADEKFNELDYKINAFFDSQNALTDFLIKYSFLPEKQLSFPLFADVDLLLTETEKIQFIFPDCWYEKEQHESLKSLAAEAAEKSAEASKITSDLEGKWKYDIFQLDAGNLLEHYNLDSYEKGSKESKAALAMIKNDRKIFKKLALVSLKNFNPAEAKNVLEAVLKRNQILQWFQENEQLFKQKFDKLFEGRNTDWNNIRAGIESAEKLTAIAGGSVSSELRKFFEKYAASDMKTQLSEMHKSISEGIVNMINFLQAKEANFDKNILFSVLYEQLVFASTSFAKMRDFSKNLFSFYHGNSEFTEGSADTLFDNLERLSEIEKWRKDNADDIAELSQICSKNDCDFDSEKIAYSLEKADAVIQLFDDCVPQKMAQNIAENRCLECSTILSEKIVELEKNSKTALKNIRDEYYIDNAENLLIADLRTIIFNARDKFIDLKMQYERVSSLYLGDRFNYKIITDSLENVHDYQTAFSDFNEKKQLCEELFLKYFTGINTDWKSIVDCFKNLVEMRNRGCTTAEILNLNGAGKAVRTAVMKLRKIVLNVAEESRWCDEKFGKSDLENMTVQDAAAQFRSCSETVRLLPQLQKYSLAKEECSANGIGDIIVEIEKNDALFDVVGGFKKAYYSKLFSQIISKNHHLARCSSDTLNKTADRLIQLEDSYINQSRATILKKLQQLLPEQNGRISAEDDMAVLTKEMCKKGRKMRTSKLFSAIPDLIQKIKPCIIVSPEAALYYLNSPKFHFDIALLDDASLISSSMSLPILIRSEQVVFFGNRQGKCVGSNRKLDFSKKSILQEAEPYFPVMTLQNYYGDAVDEIIEPLNAVFYGRNVAAKSIQNSDSAVSYRFVESSFFNINYYDNVAEDCWTCFCKENNGIKVGIIVLNQRMKVAVQQCFLHHLSTTDKNEKLDNYNIICASEAYGQRFDTVILCTDLYSEDGTFSDISNSVFLDVDNTDIIADSVLCARQKLVIIGGINREEILMTENNSLGIRLLKNYLDRTAEIDDKPSDTTDFVISGVISFLADCGYKFTLNGNQISIVKSDDDVAIIELLSYEAALENRRKIENSGCSYFAISPVAWIMNPESEKTGLMRFLRSDNQQRMQTDARKISDDDEFFEFYTITDVNSFLKRDFGNKSNNERLAECILFIVQSEQPIAKPLLLDRLIPAFKSGVNPEMIRRTIDKAIHSLGNKILIDDEGFMRLQDSSLVARIPKSNEEPRPAELICDAEIALAMRKILIHSGRMTVQQLLAETAYVFRCQRTLGTTERKLNSGFGTLIKQGEVRIIGGEVYFNGGDFADAE